jgi:hypothetical protein
MGDWTMWWVGGWYSALVWHRVKNDQVSILESPNNNVIANLLGIQDYLKAMDLLEKGFKSVHWKYEWKVPSRLHHLKLNAQCLQLPKQLAGSV